MRTTCTSPSWLLHLVVLVLPLAFHGSAVEEEAASELLDGMCLLQADFALKSQPASAEQSSQWSTWGARFPELADAMAWKSEGTASDLARVWTHLGKQWWMAFIDGQFHKDGPHALDHSVQNLAQGQDGEFYKHSQELYTRFSDPSHWDSLLTADLIAQMNAAHRGESCVNSSCFEMYGDWSSKYNPQTSSHYLNDLLTDYYKSTNALHGLERSDRLQKGLPHLARLFGKLASRHPFKDANSRTRLMVLQTELVRLGGHPVVLWGFRAAVYNDCDIGSDMSHCDLGQLQNQLLDGWCAWEIVATTGKSPFQSGQFKECYDPSTKTCLEKPRAAQEATINTYMKADKTGYIHRA